MKFVSSAGLAEAGFTGFLSIEALRTGDCDQVPREPGVYVVVREPAGTPSFLPTSTGGHFKGRDPTVPIATLERRWVAETTVLYVGKAGGSQSAATLRKRISAYVRFGSGHPVGHWGGRLIWQLADQAQLTVCWHSCAAEPRTRESELLAEFEGRYSRLPFANLVH